LPPLAQKILNDALRPKAERLFKNIGGDTYPAAVVKMLLDGAHPFDVTPVFGTILDLAESVSSHWRPGSLAFCPGEHTWIEYAEDAGRAGSRVGYLLERGKAGYEGWAYLIVVTEEPFQALRLGPIALYHAMVTLPALRKAEDLRREILAGTLIQLAPSSPLPIEITPDTQRLVFGHLLAVRLG
jgi:hypothetical protein